jgi:ribonuclease P protein component
MLSKSNRLNIKTAFPKVRGSGKKIHHPLLSLYFLFDSEITEPKLNVITSKKVAKSAVKRNRIRRLIHTVLQQNIDQLKPNTKSIFLVHKDFSNQKVEQISPLILELLKSAKLI